MGSGDHDWRVMGMKSEQETWDDFFGAAMTGFLAAHADRHTHLPDAACAATCAANIADAMIAERSKRAEARAIKQADKSRSRFPLPVYVKVEK